MTRQRPESRMYLSQGDWGQGRSHEPYDRSQARGPHAVDDHRHRAGGRIGRRGGTRSHQPAGGRDGRDLARGLDGSRRGHCAAAGVTRRDPRPDWTVARGGRNSAKPTSSMCSGSWPIGAAPTRRCRDWSSSSTSADGPPWPRSTMSMSRSAGASAGPSRPRWASAACRSRPRRWWCTGRRSGGGWPAWWRRASWRWCLTSSRSASCPRGMRRAASWGWTASASSHCSAS